VRSALGLGAALRPVWQTCALGGVYVACALIGPRSVPVAMAVTAVYLALAARRRSRRDEQLDRRAAELENRVRDRTKLLEESQRMARIGSFLWDNRTDTNLWSDELFRIHDLEPSDHAPARGYRDLIHPDDWERVHALLARTYADLQPYDDEYRIVLASGEIRWIRAHGEAITDENGTYIGMQGTCQDITDRKLADLRLAASEERFRALVQSAPDAVVVVDKDGLISFVNEQVHALLGYESHELLAQPSDKLVPKELRRAYGALRDEYAKKAGTEVTYGRDMSMQRKDGSLATVDISLAAADTPDGPVVVASIRDASARKLAEEALRSAYEREREVSESLRALDVTKTTFLQAVSHELRTPLTTISGIAALLEIGGLDHEEDAYTDMIGRLVANARRLNGLLEDLLDLDRLSRGITGARRHPTDLGVLIANTVAAIDANEHDVHVEITDVVASVDSAQTERIVENLVANAVKHTPAGTDIWVRAEQRSDGIEIVVEDAGPGVLPEIRDTLFEPFVKDTRGYVPGTGIGLALVYRFAEAHGGRVWVDDREGGGAAFHVFLANATECERAAIDAA
jgi:PAS domain S-box-containing protein